MGELGYVLMRRRHSLPSDQPREGLAHSTLADPDAGAPWASTSPHSKNRFVRKVSDYDGT